jgi:hypothetical protein
MRIGENWAAWRQRIAAGEKSPPPGQMAPWLRWTGGKDERGKYLRGPGHTFELIPERTLVLERIFSWACAGLGMRQITRRLNAEQVPCFGRSAVWRVSYVCRLMASKLVIGTFTDLNGREYEGFYPAAVDRKLWDATRGIVSRYWARGRVNDKKRHDREEVSNLFVGLVRDARDGCVMHHAARNKGNAAGVLLSAGALRGQDGSRFVSLPYHLLENLFLQTVPDLTLADVLGEGYRAEQEELKALEGRKAGLERDIAKAKARRDKGADFDAILDLIEACSADLKEVQARLDELRARRAVSEEEALASTQELEAKLRAAKGEARDDLRRKLRAAIRQLVDAVWVLVLPVNGCTRAAYIEFRLKGGGIRFRNIAWTHGGSYSGVSVRFDAPLMRGPDRPKDHADTLLPAYHISEKAREFFDRRHEKSKARILEELRQEVAWRVGRAKAGKGALERYLAEETLDRCPPSPATARSKLDQVQPKELTGAGV